MVSNASGTPEELICPFIARAWEYRDMLDVLDAKEKEIHPTKRRMLEGRLNPRLL